MRDLLIHARLAEQESQHDDRSERVTTTPRVIMRDLSWDPHAS